MPSQETPINDFGLLIAYILPGFTALWGVAYFSPEVRAWIGHTPSDAPTLGGFLYMTVASIGVGLTVSTVRWLTIDTVHHWTGVRMPSWDFSVLQQNVHAFGFLVDIHYKYYQFHANMLVALIGAYLARRAKLGMWSLPLSWIDVGFVCLAAVLFVGSRDNLMKYYARTEPILKPTTT